MHHNRSLRIITISLIAALTLSGIVPSTSSALDPRCKLNAYVPWTDGVNVRSQAVLICTAAVGEKNGVTVEKLGLWWEEMGPLVYSAASAGSKVINSPVKVAYCNGSGKKGYRARAWARSTDETTAVYHSASRDLTC